MSEWKKVKLGEVCEISAGGDRPQIFSNHITDKCRIPIYSNGIDNEGLYGFTDTPKNNGNAITITGRGANAGTVFYRKDPFLSIIRLLTLTPNSEIINAKYLFYLLKNKTFLSTGSAQPQITVPNISQFEIEFNPDIETQHRIATILSRYDSLIENYQKQIKLLEEAAQRLYKEWFIDLHFPGHENTNIIDGVPEGWEKKKLNNLVNLQSGYAFKSSTFEDSGQYKIVTIKNVKDGLFDGDNVSFIKSIPEKMPTHCLLQTGDILLSLTGNVGRVCFVIGKNYLLNQRVAKLDSHYPAFTYCLFRNHDMFIAINNLANGAAQQNVSPIKIGELYILVADNGTMDRFEQIAGNYRLKIIDLQSQIRLLTEARDRLLPKLMGGEIVLS